MKTYVSTSQTLVDQAEKYLTSRPYTKGIINPAELITEVGLTNHSDAKNIVFDWMNEQIFNLMVPGYEKIADIINSDSDE